MINEKKKRRKQARHPILPVVRPQSLMFASVAERKRIFLTAVSEKTNPTRLIISEIMHKIFQETVMIMLVGNIK